MSASSKRRHALRILTISAAALVFLFAVIFALAWQMGMFNLTPEPQKPDTVSDSTASITDPEETPPAVETTETDEEVNIPDIVMNEFDEFDQTASTTEGIVDYVEVVEGCGPHFEGECVNVRSGPGTDFPVVARLRTGMVLRAGGKIVVDDRTWINIMFNEHIRYPERITDDWFIAADLVKIVYDEGDRSKWSHEILPTEKHIVVDRSEFMLYAYDGDELFLKTSISTGLELTPTPHGEFSVFMKTPSRYMQGPTPGSDQVYDLPGVPWNLYFTEDGSVIHGAYWHNSFGQPYSHGCVNVPLNVARKLYRWTDLGTKVIVQD